MSRGFYFPGIPRTIERDLTLVLVFIVFSFSSLIIFSSYYYRQRTDIDALNRRSDEIMEQLIGSVSFHVWNYSEDDIESLMDSFLAIDEIAWIKIKYNTNIKKAEKGEYLHHDLFFLRSSISYQNYLDIGQAELALSINKMQEKNRKDMLRAFILIIIILVLIAGTIKVIMNTVFRKPLRKLSSAIEDISGGNYQKIQDIFPQKEINTISRDINLMTESIIQRESNLRRMKDMMDNIFEAMAAPIVSINDNFDIMQINEKAFDIIDFDEKDIIGKNIFHVTQFFNKYEAMMKKAYKELKTKEIFKEYIIHKNGKSGYYNIKFYPYSFRNTQGLVILIDDIDKIIKNEEKLKKIQKMEIVSNLSGGLAHDFNNILAGVIGSVSLLKWEANNEEEMDLNTMNENIQLIEESSQRAERIVGQLLTLAREHEYQFNMIDLNTVLDSVYDICKNSLQKTVRLEIRHSEDKAIVMADSNQLEQLLLSLSINAAHAMTIMRDKDEDPGGTLSFYLERIYADEKFQKNHPNAKKHYYWMISVQDTGIGIDKDKLDRIFEPFFTTKAESKSSGLGLSIVYNIVKEHDGFIDVYSEKKVGTTFNIYLPEYFSNMKSFLSAEPVPQKRRTGLVLLCEDEDIARRIGIEMLNAGGYEVIAAKDGFEAIELYKDYCDRISIVVLDAIMPGITGDIVYKELKKINPAIKGIISSGFRKDHRVANAMEAGADLFLSKPYTIGKLNRAIDQVLNRDDSNEK